MKNGLGFVLFLVVSLAAQAQQRFGNEWIQPGQRYVKIAVVRAGVYRVGPEALRAADPTLAQTDPTRWQLFFRGREVAIRVAGEQDGRFDAPDYLEFYGQGNDGAQDSLLYRPQQRLHPYQSLFSDTAAYFLTCHPTARGRRMAITNRSAQGLTPEPFHLEETVRAFTSEYTFNNLRGIEPFLQHSFYEPGEGWSGRLLTPDSVATVRLPLVNRVAGPVGVQGMVNGRDNGIHEIRVQADGSAAPLTTLRFGGFSSQTFRQAVDPVWLAAETLTLRFNGDKNPRAGRFSVTYVTLSYPQATDMGGAASKRFRLPPNPGGAALALLAVKNAPDAPLAYDLTDPLAPRWLAVETSTGEARLVVDGATQQREVLVTNEIFNPLFVKAVRFQSSLPPTANYLLITHAALRSSAETYARYRASAAGGNHRPALVEADSLYDAFNFGEKSPLALRRFLDFALATTQARHLLLVGRARSYPYDVKTTPDDRVPTVGYPGSDVLLSAGLRGFGPNTPALPTGRLNATTNEQVLAYLEKVKQQEGATPNGPWRKHVIHLSGGKTPDEARSLRAALAGLGEVFRNGVLGGQVSAFGKTTTAEVEPVDIVPLVNEGVSLITFFGHAGPSVTDLNFGYATPPENGFRNTRYPLMVFNGCGVGEIFSRFNTLSTDWLLAPGKGAAAVLAHSYWSFQQPTTRYLNRLYTALFADPTTLGMPLGRVQQRVNQALDVEGLNPYDVSMLLEMVLQGDPALSTYPLPEPDYAVEGRGLSLQAPVAGSPLRSADSLRLVVPLVNLGRFAGGTTVAVSVKKTTAAGTTTVPLRFEAFRFRDTLTYTLAKDPVLQRLEVVVDPDNRVTELSETNNAATLTLDWTQVLAGTSYPPNLLPDRVGPSVEVLVDGRRVENPATVAPSPVVAVYLLDENPLSPLDPNAVEVLLKPCAACTPQKLTVARRAVSENQLLATVGLSLQPGATYQLLVFGQDAAGNRTPSPYALDLRVPDADEPASVTTYPNPATAYARFEVTLNTRTPPTQARLTIYHATGQRVFDEILPVATGQNAFLWRGTAAGLYPYTLHLTWPDGRTETKTGKVVWQP